ncbi:tetratricopeptide repeat protein [Chryseobacterium viscerum]|uniref:Tetratricopeptide repeat protein n=1 Tax=Chryseobacterium viscerum TaxID=1037377 RepID=A0A5N4BQ89_9FLAO|nr:tetratricopeptide repeat protein [Chryseobacterium viscerum]KAB1230589.1 tetratricopeptide repeat protein [Chryseobacterium viscerum]
MRDKITLFLLLTLFSNLFFAQSSLKDFEAGNNLLSENKFFEAENLFRKALKENPDNLDFRSQLALALIKQNKNEEAEKNIIQVLKKDLTFSAALWYGGLNNFHKNKPDFRQAISYFERFYKLTDENSNQYFAVNFYIGKSYQNLLYTEGLSYDEVSRMLETYKKYVELETDTEVTNKINSFIKSIEENRPGKNVEKWMVATTIQNAANEIKK